VAVRDARVRYPLGVQPEEVNVLGDHNASRGRREREVILIRGPRQVSLCRGRYVNASQPKGVCEH